jgi:hypothetical protein
MDQEGMKIISKINNKRASNSIHPKLVKVAETASKKSHTSILTRRHRISAGLTKWGTSPGHGA